VNMLSCVTRRLDSSKCLIGPDVHYPASVGPSNPQNLFAGCSEEQSVAMGRSGAGRGNPRYPEPCGDPRIQVAHVADGINCCPADSPLPTLADTMSAFSFAALGGWGSALAEHIRGNRWQLNHRDRWRDPIHHWQL
jgi:hypothetical protein